MTVTEELEMVEGNDRVSGWHHRVGFGGGLGLGTPVVSYAPRPIFMNVVSLRIIEALRIGGWRLKVVAGLAGWYVRE